MMIRQWRRVCQAHLRQRLCLPGQDGFRSISVASLLTTKQIGVVLCCYSFLKVGPSLVNGANGLLLLLMSLYVVLPVTEARIQWWVVHGAHSRTRFYYEVSDFLRQTSFRRE
jgi:hypothetical protein